MIKITQEQILTLHSELTYITGGSNDIRDIALLSSALNAPFQQFDNTDLFPTIQQKAGRLGYGLIKNHPFIDGNKRTGIHTMLIFLEINGISLEYTQKELYTMVIDVASGAFDTEEIAEWILNHQI
ncbi:MAG: type II toxin-antitoxin system death-on-curing family toxin [Acutalibacteraceae bacterium]|nr:type II toxin-antitoxin system death-on-curing family toxin [Acutalibacteraceae bacterium]